MQDFSDEDLGFRAYSLGFILVNRTCLMAWDVVAGTVVIAVSPESALNPRPRMVGVPSCKRRILLNLKVINILGGAGNTMARNGMAHASCSWKSKAQQLSKVSSWLPTFTGPRDKL